MTRGPLLLEHALDIDDARLASRRMADQRRDLENTLQEAITEAVDAEAAYRMAYAKAMVQAEGAAPVREAQAKAETAEEYRRRDYGDRMVKLYHDKLRGLEGERSQLKSLMEWSSRMNAVGVE